MHILYLKDNNGRFVKGFRHAYKKEDKVIYNIKNARIYKRRCDLINSILNVYTYESAIDELKHLICVDHYITDVNIINSISLETILEESFKNFLLKEIKNNKEILSYWPSEINFNDGSNMQSIEDKIKIDTVKLEKLK
jgi:hypothetical protein